MSMTAPVRDITVCIVSYNTCRHLRECLASIFDTVGRLSIEVIVVDNASTDGSAAMVRSEFPSVQLIENDHNRYFTGANNQALCFAKGRYILILNSDTLILSGTLEAMVRFMDGCPQAGAATCRASDLEGQPIVPFWRFRRVADLVKFLHPWILLTEGNLSRDAVNAQLDHNQRAQVIVDGWMIMRQAARQAIGLYDERFLLYYTEDDICQRLNQAGWEVHYIASARVIHKCAHSTRQLPKFSHRRINARDMVHYAWKYYGVLDFVTIAILAYLDLGAVGIGMAVRYMRNFPVRWHNSQQR